MPTVGAVCAYLEQIAPPAAAAEWDNVGLLLGDRDAEAQRILTCLTVTPEVVAEAIEVGAQLVVTHHPILFRPTKRLTSDTPDGRLLLPLARAGIAVYSPHTAFDNCAGGINDLLAIRLGLLAVGPLRQRVGPGRCKVVVFVPDKDLARVSDALFAAGAGRIGQYSECSFRLAGTGTFFGSEQTNPSVGSRGRREEVSEWRLEAVCPEDAVEAVVAAMRRAHSYEEPAYDVYPLRPMAPGAGEGRIGHLPQPLPLGQLAQQLKDGLKAGAVQVVGERSRPVKSLALACGAGGEFLRDAIGARADVLVTGEARFHDMLSARAHGLALLLPGHYATERLGVEDLARRLTAKWPDLEAWASRRECDPAHWVGP
jgi:dinuclear metal center YbgI/SA1388 family protein